MSELVRWSPVEVDKEQEFKTSVFKPLDCGSAYEVTRYPDSLAIGSVTSPDTRKWLDKKPRDFDSKVFNRLFPLMGLPGMSVGLPGVAIESVVVCTTLGTEGYNFYKKKKMEQARAQVKETAVYIADQDFTYTLADHTSQQELAINGPTDSGDVLDALRIIGNTEETYRGLLKKRQAMTINPAEVVGNMLKNLQYTDSRQRFLDASQENLVKLQGLIEEHDDLQTRPINKSHASHQIREGMLCELAATLDNFLAYRSEECVTALEEESKDASRRSVLDSYQQAIAVAKNPRVNSERTHLLLAVTQDNA